MKKLLLINIIFVITFYFPEEISAWNTFNIASNYRLHDNYFPFSQVRDSLYLYSGKYIFASDSLAPGFNYKSVLYEFSERIAWFVVDNNYNKFIATLNNFFLLPTTGERVDLISKYGLNITFPIDHIELDSKQNLWFTSKNGLWYFNRMEDKISKKLELNITDKKDSINILRIDKEDNAWVVKGKKSIYRFQGDSLHKFDLGQMEDSLYAIYQIKFDENNFLWFCTLNGLFKYNGTTFINYNRTNNNFPTDTILDFEWEGSEKLWCAAYHKIFYTDLNKTMDTIGYYKLWESKYKSASKVWIDIYKNKYFLIDEYSEGDLVSILWIYNEEDVRFTDIVQEYSILNKTLIYPNPVSDYTQLKLEKEFSGFVSVSIVDLLGNSNAVFKGEINGNIPLDLDFSAFPTGFYSLIIDYGTIREVVKVIKQ